MSKAPSYQRYPDKWLAGTKRLSWMAKGIYADVLDTIWLHFQETCAFPDDEAFACGELKCSKDEWMAARAEILNPIMPLLTKTESGGLFSNGLWKERCKMLAFREKQRENGLKGGRPKKTQKTHSETQTKAKKSPPSPTPSPTPSPKEDKRVPAPPSEIARTLARQFMASIASWKPDFKQIQPSFANKTESTYAKDFDLMLRVDSRKPQRVQEIIRWLPGYEGYGGFRWRNNILSASKFREQFDKLEIAMGRSSRPQDTLCPDCDRPMSCCSCNEPKEDNDVA